MESLALMLLTGLQGSFLGEGVRCGESNVRIPQLFTAISHHAVIRY